MAKLHHSKVEAHAFNGRRAKTKIDTRDIFDKALESPNEQIMPLNAGTAKAKALRTRGANTINSLSPGRAIGHGYSKRST